VSVFALRLAHLGLRTLLPTSTIPGCAPLANAAAGEAALEAGTGEDD
jgi:hypothetical protein